MARLKASQFAFRRSDKVGAEGAEQDEEFLVDCFFERGDLQTLSDPTNPRAIIVGRTGAGKTALLKRLKDEQEHFVMLDPGSLSLHYLSDTSIIRKLEDMGIKLSLFYKLLWRHVFAVELIKAKYSLRTEDETRGFFEKFISMIGLSKDKAKEKSFTYLVSWGKTFWQDTEYRVKEVTSKLETEIKDTLGVKFAPVFEASTVEGAKLTVEEKAEVTHKLQEAVNHIQVRELTKIIDTLAEEVFCEAFPRYYIAIDKLDEDWVDDPLRYNLIKALIEATREFNSKFASAKVIVAIRRDLLDQVFQATVEPGFQEEKYNPLFLDLRWNDNELLGMLDKRVAKLIHRRYIQQPVSWVDVLPAKVGLQPISEFLVDQTMNRPRDLIVFFNFCIAQAVDKPEITAKMISAAENEYSPERLRSLRDEWLVAFPELDTCAELLKKKPEKFTYPEFDAESLTDFCLTLASGKHQRRGPITHWAEEVSEQRMSIFDFYTRITSVFYKVGLVGLKLETFTSDQWSFRHGSVVAHYQINEQTTVFVNPIFHRALGIRPAN